MDIYILLLTTFIFLVSFYTSIKISVIISKKIIAISLILSLILSISSFLMIKFLNSNLNHDFFIQIKLPFIIFLIFSIYATIKVLNSNIDFLYDDNKKFNNLFNIPFVIFFIGVSCFFYFIFNKDLYTSLDLFLNLSFIVLVTGALMLIYEITFILVSFLIIALLNFKFEFIFSTAVSLFLLFLYNSFILWLNNKCFQKIINIVLKNIEYKKIKKNHLLFVSKFKPYFVAQKIDNYILYYKNEENGMIYFIKLNLRNGIIDILLKNLLNIFFLKSQFTGHIKVSFKNLRFYCHSDKDVDFFSLKSIDVKENVEDIEYELRTKFYINAIQEY